MPCVIEQVFNQTHKFVAYSDILSFLIDLFGASISSVDTITKGVVGICLYVFNIFSFIYLFRNFKNEIAFKVSGLCLFSSLSAISVSLIGFYLKLFNLPFLRSILYVPVFIQISSLLFSFLFIKNFTNFWGKFNLFYISIVQILLTCILFFSAFIYRPSYIFPFFSETVSTSLVVANKNKLNFSNKELVVSSFHQFVPRIYQQYLGYKLTLIDDFSLLLKEECLFGTRKTELYVKARRKKNSGLLCF